MQGNSAEVMDKSESLCSRGYLIEIPWQNALTKLLCHKSAVTTDV